MFRYLSGGILLLIIVIAIKSALEPSKNKILSPLKTTPEIIIMARKENYFPDQSQVPGAVAKNFRDDMVSQKLNNFITRTSNITAEDILEEQKRLSEKRNYYQNMQETPRESIFTENTERWKKMVYENGTIRYELLSDQNSEDMR